MTEPERTPIDMRILRNKLPEWYSQSPRICLLQIHTTQTSDAETEAKRKALETALAWDYEDYVGNRPEGSDPKADVGVCGIGGCTLRMFETTDGSDIKVGECKAADYCLADKFDEVQQAPTAAEGSTLYRAIIDTCDSEVSSQSVGNSCPRLDCGLSAGVSEDMVPGTSGTCARRDVAQSTSHK